ncbi:MAG: hypothetical protein OXC62_10485 [Aestuariivita sp.]|nr:hypothetical protein [Aestuariivita sp.]
MSKNSVVNVLTGICSFIAVTLLAAAWDRTTDGSLVKYLSGVVAEDIAEVQKEIKKFEIEVLRFQEEISNSRGTCKTLHLSEFFPLSGIFLKSRRNMSPFFI